MRGLPAWVSAVVLLWVATAGPAGLAAAVTNGSFETGDLSGWDSGHSFYGSGPPQVVETFWDMSLPPADGDYCATLEAYALSPGDGHCYAWLEQEFAAEAGEVLRFSWAGFYSARGLDDAGVYCEAFARISVLLYEAQYGPGSPMYDAGLTGSALGGDSSSQSTGGWVAESWTIPSAGDYVLRFYAEGEIMGDQPGGMEMPDAMAQIGADHVRLVPEPATLVLLAVGGWAVLRRRRTG